MSRIRQIPAPHSEVLQCLAEGFTPDEVYRDVVAERRPVEASYPSSDSLAIAIANTANWITLVSSADELAEILGKPFAAWRVFLHPSQRRVAYRPTYVHRSGAGDRRTRHRQDGARGAPGTRANRRR